MAAELYLSLVIPAYNEEARIRASLAEVTDYLSGRPYPWEVLVADDGSADATASLVQEAAQREHRIRVLTLPHWGKGYAVKSGMLAAQGEYRFFSDADLATPIQELERLLPLLEQGYDAAIATREGPGARRVGEPWRRHLLGRGFHILIWLLGVKGFPDTQCGFKGFRAGAARRLFVLQRTDGFAFDVELLFLARRLGLKVAQVPVTWRYGPGSKVRPLRHSLAMLREVLAVRWAAWRGRYRE